MSRYIILSAAQAAAARGVSPVAKWAVIEPIALDDGTYLINEEVLTDPAHSSKTRTIAALTKYDRTAIESRLVKTVDADIKTVDGK